jgi:hypothetical protein
VRNFKALHILFIGWFTVFTFFLCLPNTVWMAFIPEAKWFGKVSAKSMWLTARRQTQAKPELRRGLATKLLAAATSENDSNHFDSGIFLLDVGYRLSY